MRFVDGKGKRQCEIFDFSQRERNRASSGKKTEETVLHIGRELKHENLLSNDHISPVKAS